MGCCGMFKPLRTSAKDSKTGCCTIVKVLTFYVLGCSACRKARKRVPKAIRRKFSESWRHEVDLGSNFPEDSDEEIEPRPRLANVSSSSTISSEYFLDKRDGNASATISRLPHSLKCSTSREFKDLSEAEMNDARKEVLDSHHPSIASLTLRSSAPEEREWMFLPPKATKEMRGIRNGRGTRITKENMREKSFRGSIGVARAEAERRERESNGAEKWDIREIGTLNDGFWQGTNKWEPFRIKKKVSFSPVATQATRTPDKTKGTDSAPENQPLKPRDTSPHPPPPPIWPASLTSVVSSQSSRNTTNRQSIATSTSSPTRRGSEDTATTGSTDLTIPDSPWLKEAIASPLPVTPVMQSPNLGPRDQQNTKLSGYLPELNLNVTKIPVLESSDSQDQNLNSLVVNSTGPQLSGISATLLEIFRNTKYKPHLVWEEWKGQKKESLQVVGEAQMVALADLSDKRPGIHPSFHVLHEENSTSREWRPWFAMEKKVKRRQSDPELPSTQEGGGEVVTVEDVFSGKEPGFKFPNLWKWSKPDQKGKGKVKPEEYDGCEIHPLNGTLYDFGEWGFNKPPESNTGENKTDGYRPSTSFNVEISEIGGGEGFSKEEGTEEYERLRMGIGEWEKEDYEAAMKGWGRGDVEKALMLDRIENMDNERKKRDSRCIW